jgi:hypothetical protein
MKVERSAVRNVAKPKKVVGRKFTQVTRPKVPKSQFAKDDARAKPRRRR